MHFSIFAITSLFAVSALAKPLKGWTIDNENEIMPFYHIVSHNGAEKWVTKAQIIKALTDAASTKHDDSIIKKAFKTRGTYPHIYTNDNGPWPALADTGSMAHGQYFEMQIGSGQRDPLDARAVYTIEGDDSPKNAKMGEKQPLTTHFIGVMKHGANRGDAFEIVDGQEKQDETEQTTTTTTGTITNNKNPLEKEEDVDTGNLDTENNRKIEEEEEKVNTGFIPKKGGKTKKVIEEEEKIDTRFNPKTNRKNNRKTKEEVEEKIEPKVVPKRKQNRKFREESEFDDEPTDLSENKFGGQSGSRFGGSDKFMKRMVPITFRG